VDVRWIEPREPIAARMARVTAPAQACGRTVPCGWRTHLGVGGAPDAAWAAAARPIARAAPRVVPQRQAVLVGPPRIGAHRWKGRSTVRVTCGTAMAGTPPQVTGERLAYWRLGLDECVLSGFPHLEECIRVRQAIVPRRRAAMAAAPVDQGGGEAVVMPAARARRGGEDRARSPMSP
jgi:alkanesulfonate monooxygenase